MISGFSREIVAPNEVNEPYHTDQGSGILLIGYLAGLCCSIALNVTRSSSGRGLQWGTFEAAGITPFERHAPEKAKDFQREAGAVDSPEILLTTDPNSRMLHREVIYNTILGRENSDEGNCTL